MYYLKTHNQGKQLMTYNELSLQYNKITAVPSEYYEYFPPLNASGG